MGLDDFKSGNGSSSTSSTKNKQPDSTDTGIEHDVDLGSYTIYNEEYEHPSAEKDFHTEYDEEHYSECWECGNRKIRISWLSEVGNVWFCQNKDCTCSVKHRCEDPFNATGIAQKLDYNSLHSEMKKQEFDPTDMSLDEFTGGDSNDESSSGNKRVSQMFTRERFEEVLDTTEYDWKLKDYDWSGEWIYEVGSSDGGYVMRIYSSVDKRTEESRPKDGDAIRLVVLYGEDQRPVLKEKRTNRIKTWPKNLKGKIDNIKQRQEDIQMCSECKSVMVIRENSSTGDKFYGCSNYPECSNTENID